jgi:hypothetical protein
MTHHDYTDNPFLNIIISFLLALIGSTTPQFVSSVNFLDSIHIPLVIMQLFQILAWSSAVVIMLLTVYKTLKKKE